jgi:NitT/TauT family transport system substrate-binding protein
MGEKERFTTKTRRHKGRWLTLCLRVFVVNLLLIATAHADDPLRLGLLHTLSPAPFYIAQERGYFRDEGIDLTFRFFEAAQPIAAAAVSGDIDVGITALTGGFFNLAEKGALKVIGGGLHEQRGYEGSAILVSNKAYAAGLTSPTNSQATASLSRNMVRRSTTC